MKFLIVGFAAFVVWCVFSAWMYNDKLLPVLRTPEPVPVIPEKTSAADSLAKIYASMPEKLSVYFEFNKSNLKADQLNEGSLNAFRDWIDKHPGSKLYVTGHTDLVGTEAYNNDLAMERAVAVGKFIEGKGFPSDKMIVESKGETEPAADYLTEDGRAKNRRSEITIKLE